MSKKEKNVKTSPYSPAVLLKDFIVFEVILTYITLRIGDEIRKEFEDASLILARYIPIAIVTLLSVFFAIKHYSKKCKKSEEKLVRKNVFIAPVIVAVIILIYGVYSVSVNMVALKGVAKTTTFLYSLVDEESEIQEEVDRILDEARTHAIQSWIITSVIYLLVAEGVAFMRVKKLHMYLKDDVPEITFEETPQGDFINVDNTVTDNDNEQNPINTVKFDL